MDFSIAKIIDQFKQTDEENKSLKAQIEELKKQQQPKPVDTQTEEKIKQRLTEIFEFVENANNLNSDAFEEKFNRYKYDLSPKQFGKIYTGTSSSRNGALMETFAKQNRSFMPSIIGENNANHLFNNLILSERERMEILLKSRMFGSAKFEFIKQYCNLGNVDNVRLLIQIPKHYLLATPLSNFRFGRKLDEFMTERGLWTRDLEIQAVINDPYMLSIIQNLTNDEISTIIQNYRDNNLQIEGWNGCVIGPQNFSSEKEMFRFIFEMPEFFDVFGNLSEKQRAISMIMFIYGTAHKKDVPNITFEKFGSKEIYHLWFKVLLPKGTDFETLYKKIIE